MTQFHWGWGGRQGEKGYQPMDKENYAEMLHQVAVQRFGEERAKSLYPAIQEIAQSLVFIADCAIAFEEEPAFFS